ncbi:DUF1893 domain-containing protein [Candidatus Bathyarchaeota archaeon]|nr:DUF1893 domain-containing protein [Candidatus Bathyarchaeota archaeon]
MLDIDLAKKILKDKEASLVIVKEGQIIFKSYESGIFGLLKAIEKLNNQMRGASVADKVVGRATALLLAYSHIKEVYAFILSIEGKKVLEINNIKVNHQMLVKKILDRTGKDICPFEKFSYSINSIEQAYEQLRNFAEEFLNKKIFYY